jgi:putative Mg2+ transporter-C (MgtC) family protein
MSDLSPDATLVPAQPTPHQCDRAEAKAEPLHRQVHRVHEDVPEARTASSDHSLVAPASRVAQSAEYAPSRSCEAARAELSTVTSDWSLLARVGLGFALAFVVGFEREVRGSPAGDRTFALIGAATAALTAVLYKTSPQGLAGVITGIGFIGAGVVFHTENTLVRGISTASAIYATAAIGVVVGSGRLLVGVATAAIVLFILELRFIPGLRRLDARRYRQSFRDDNDPPAPLHP